MIPGNSRRPEKGALEIIEEASLLLRVAPVGNILRYYLGTAPFVLGFLLFWVDMSSRGTAGPHLAHASLGIAVLYIWMKCWQAVFVSRLRSFLEEAPPAGWNRARLFRLVGIQSALTPCMAILLPLALLVALPFGWCYAFFQNISIFGDGCGKLKTSTRSAWRQSLLWPAQNHKIILIYLVLTVVAFFNICAAAYLVPTVLLKGLLGIETVFSRNSAFFLNTTFLLAMACVTYLCVNPLIKAAYVLRCFYGESLSSGRDILADWGRLHRFAGRTVLVFAITVATLFFSHNETAGAGISTPPAVQTVPPERLDRAISDVIGGTEYSWRLPRERVEEPKSSGFPGQVLETVGSWLKKLWGWLVDAVEWLSEWLGKLMGEQSNAAPAKRSGMSGSVKLWLTLLLAVAAVTVALLLRKVLKAGKPCAKAVGGEAPGRSEVDLSDEQISADQLPESRWLTLAKNLLKDGEYRLALRAFHFAALVHLSDRSLLTVSRFKSNRDYERELRRRAHAFPGLIDAFSENITILEKVWYGMHSAGQGTIRKFLDNQEQITADAHVR